MTVILGKKTDADGAREPSAGVIIAFPRMLDIRTSLGRRVASSVCLKMGKDAVHFGLFPSRRSQVVTQRLYPRPRANSTRSQIRANQQGWSVSNDRTLLWFLVNRLSASRQWRSPLNTHQFNHRLRYLLRNTSHCHHCGLTAAF